jgi:hypothetical protein
MSQEEALETFLRSVSGLDHRELASLRKRCLASLSQMYVERVYPITEALFSDGGEIWLHHVILPLSLTESSAFLCSLRRVNGLWNRLMGQVRHLNFRGNSCQIYSAEFHGGFHRSFPLCVSISLPSHVQVSCLCRDMVSRSFPLVEKLAIRKDTVHEGKYQSISCFPNLTSLSVPHVPYIEIDLECLANLTELDVSALSFKSMRDLTNFALLRRLTIRGSVQPSVEALQPLLTNLTYLSSDRLGHFKGFTGQGHYKMMRFARDEHDALSYIQPYCYPVTTLDGTWRDGLFSGLAHLKYDPSGAKGPPDECFYKGDLVDGLRHGRGVESLSSLREEYDGEWRWGKRHGRGCLHSWRGGDRWQEGEWVENVCLLESDDSGIDLCRSLGGGVNPRIHP